MFLMLVLLHITSQPAQQPRPSKTLITLSALAMVPFAVKAGTKWYTHVKAWQCANMPDGPNKEQSVYDLLSLRSLGDMLSGRRDDQLYAIQLAEKHGFNY